jgi:zinc D-Ala-D-Ala dipeptidase
MRITAVKFNSVSIVSFKVLLATLIACASSQGHTMIPAGFVYLSQHCPTILIGANYATSDNFTGEVVAGYRRVEAVFSKKGADALCRVQAEAAKQGLNLKIFDAYRPVKAVSFFQDWGKRPGDVPEMKERYYPHYTKAQLFELGYIALRSSHSRGSAVDLTLVDAQGQELDMGTVFDFFHEHSHTESTGVTAAQLKNRRLLGELMSKQGFKNYHKEWWHFSLIEEAFPGRSFDFDIE